MAISTDAVCVHAKCGKTLKDFYMMYYKAYDGTWVRTYGKRELPRQSGNSGSSVSVQLTPMRTGPQYKCPHCSEVYTFTCWNCGKHTCYNGDSHEGREVICGHCGKSGVFRSGGGGGRAKDTMGIGMSGQ